MIKVINITPIDLASKYMAISELEDDYKNLFKKNHQPKLELLNAINDTKKGQNSITNKKELAILTYLESMFDDILVQKPNELNETILLFKKKKWDSFLYKNKNTTPFGKKILDIYGYTQHFRSQVRRGIWLASQLNIKTCPYCNAQYTILASHSKSQSIAKFQFDHFFSKDKFPYLSLSLYNLIPSCANCNITKSKKLLNLKEHYHPYYLDFSNYFRFHLKFNPDPTKLTINTVNTQKFEIELVSKFKGAESFVNEHNNLYHIKAVYNRHQDIAEDLLMKAVIYTNHLQKAHLAIQGLFSDQNEYKRYLLGSYSEKSKILHRPLGKFVQDIAFQLGLI